MATGKTITQIMWSRMMGYRKPEPAPTTVRDRSLRGKQRVKARKADNKE